MCDENSFKFIFLYILVWWIREKMCDIFFKLNKVLICWSFLLFFLVFLLFCIEDVLICGGICDKLLVCGRYKCV